MQSCSFRQKINKQHNVVLKQLSRFRNGWQGRTIEPSKLQTYCKQVDYMTQLHSTYVYNCIEYFTPSMRQQMIQVNKAIVQDLVKKLRYFSQYNQKSLKSYLLKQKKQVCQLCSSKIRQVDVKLIKQHLSDDASLRRTLLRKIYADLENENADLFSKDEDEMFFKFLNRILVKKQELLAMQTKELNDFLFQVTKSLTDLNFLTEYTPGNFGVGQFRENYKQDLSKTITDSLKTGFGDKIHPWMEKVFESVKKQILTQKNAGNVHKSCQTQQDPNMTKKRSQYIASSENKKQLQNLKQQIQSSTLTITDLKGKLSVLEKQKKQLQQYYAAQVQSLMMQKRQIEVKLRKTETDFYHLKQTNEEISEVNRRLRSEKKKTQQSLTNKSNRSVRDMEMSKSQKDGIDQGKSEKGQQRQQSKKKKKSPMNRLLTKKSQSSQKTLFVQQKTQYTKQMKENNNTELLMKKTGSEMISKHEKYVSDQLPTIEIKQSKKKSLKNLDLPLSRKQKSSQNQLKVEFKLQDSRSNQKRISLNNHNSKKSSLIQSQDSRKSITQVSQQRQQPTNRSPLLKKKSSFVNEKSSSILGNKPSPKRMLSIEMTIPPVIKYSRQQKRQQQPYVDELKVTVEENQQGLSTVGQQSFNLSKSPSNHLNNQFIGASSRKKVFEFIPLENKQQYEQMKQKISDITTKIQLKTSQKLKSSIKNFQSQRQGGDLQSMSEMGKVFGYSIFSKKATQKKGKKDMNNITTRRGNGNNESNLNNSNSTNQNYEQLMNDSINQQQQQGVVIDEIVQQQNGTQRSKGIQTSFKSINDTQSFNLTNNYNNNNISINDRKELYQKIKRQEFLPKTLTFQHYELMVRKLFSELQKGQQQLSIQNNDTLNNTKYQPRTSSLNHYNNINIDPTNILAKLKQTQSVKINIDANFLNYQNSKVNKIHQQSRVILNLPKLDRIAYNKMQASNIAKVSNNNNLSNNNNRPHFNINTMRQKLTGLKTQCSNDLTELNVKLTPQKRKQHSPIQSAQQSLFKSAQVTPNLIKTTNNLPKYKQVFGQDDLKIFFDTELAAYQYQQISKYNFKNQQKQPKLMLQKLSQKEKKIIESLYSIMLQIKLKNHQVYHKICSFIKYPYQTVKHGFEFINIGKDIQFQKWTHYLLKIYALKKQKQQRLIFSEFIKPFEEKLVELIVIVNTG